MAGSPVPSGPSAPSAPSAPGSAPKPALNELAARVERHRLPNGWTLLLLPRRDVPAVAFHTLVEVGGVNEPLGQGGIAHMFEHMAFKGSARIGSRDWEAERAALEREEAAAAELERARQAGSAGSADAADAARRAERELERAREAAAGFVDPEAFTRQLEQAGGAGTLNASTSAEETRYYVSLPSHRVELWFWMERERFDAPVLREFYQERAAVQEERRMRVESSGVGQLWEALLATAFRVHPYGRPVIGSPEDIAGLTRTRAELFRRAQYGARRAISCLCGDFDPAEALALAERYFGGLPPGAERAPLAEVEPEPDGERRVVVRFPSSPRLVLAWRTPPLGHPDEPAVELLLRALGASRGARLERRLVRELGIASHVGTGTGFPGDRWPNLAVAIALPSHGVSLDALEQALRAEVADMAARGPSDAELAAAVLRARAEILRGARRSAWLAAGLCEYQSKCGDALALFARAPELGAVSAERVRDAAARYLRPERMTVARLERAGPEAARASALPSQSGARA